MNMESKRINEIIEKYWLGETSLEEESYILEHLSMIENEEERTFFSGIRETQEARIPQPFRLEEIIETKTVKLYPAWMKVAAGIALVATIGMGIFLNRGSVSQTSPMASVEETFEDPQLAREQAEIALQYVFKNINKGQKKTTKQLKKIETLRIIL